MFYFRYPAKFTRCADGRVLVELIDFPRAATDGNDMREAMAEAEDCLGSVISFAIVDNEDIPPPSPLRRGLRAVNVPLYLAPKLALYLAMRGAGISPSQLARRLGVPQTAVRRLLDPKQELSPEKIQAALATLGKHVCVAMEDAA
ncbi:MAG: type II toxin-antitoxin system HicB family antitoxin [Acidobacteria bacterium]|nr:type II toxin-antitoxin system HicB family antitoxin [Acidobacteriota bacterium]